MAKGDLYPCEMCKESTVRRYKNLHGQRVCWDCRKQVFDFHDLASDRTELSRIEHAFKVEKIIGIEIKQIDRNCLPEKWQAIVKYRNGRAKTAVRQFPFEALAEAVYGYGLMRMSVSDLVAEFRKGHR